MKEVRRQARRVIALWVFVLFSGFFSAAFGSPLPCCSEDSGISYFLSPKSSQKYRYSVRYETFLSSSLEKEKGFFVILPESFFSNPGEKYPVLFLLHGYNFHRTGAWWKVRTPEKAQKVLCEVKEEEYHWISHENIAVIAYAMMDPGNRTYRELEKSLEMRFQELSQFGGLSKGDNTPGEIAHSIVSNNLHPPGGLNDPFHPIRKMVIVLPDGDNGFYTDENEGKILFPETKSQKACDEFYPGESLNYSLLPFFYMKPGALGKHESYFLELIKYFESLPAYRGRLSAKRGLGGISMGGFGAVKLALKYPGMFQSASSQSGLLDIELLQNKWMLKMVLPEFLEIFGRLEPQEFPPASSLDPKYIQN